MICQQIPIIRTCIKWYLLCQLDTDVTEIIDLVIHLLRSSSQTLLHHCKYTVDSGNLMEMMTVKAYIVELFIEIQMPSVQLVDAVHFQNPSIDHLLYTH